MIKQEKKDLQQNNEQLKHQKDQQNQQLEI